MNTKRVFVTADFVHIWAVSELLLKLISLCQSMKRLTKISTQE